MRSTTTRLGLAVATLGEAPENDDAGGHRWRPGDLRHTASSAESCCLPALTRFTGHDCTGPDRHLRERATAQGSLSRPGRVARAAESARLESV